MACTIKLTTNLQDWTGDSEGTENTHWKRTYRALQKVSPRGFPATAINREFNCDLRQLTAAIWAPEDTNDRESDEETPG